MIRDATITRNKEICGGQPHITGTRIKVQHIAIEYDRMGWSPDQICDAHPDLTLAQVHSAISYYYSHKTEIDQIIQSDENFAERLHKSLS
jgi:uncharacterized protein (DUF433 family)